MENDIFIKSNSMKVGNVYDFLTSVFAMKNYINLSKVNVSVYIADENIVSNEPVENVVHKLFGDLKVQEGGTVSLEATINAKDIQQNINNTIGAFANFLSNFINDDEIVRLYIAHEVFGFDFMPKNDMRIFAVGAKNNTPVTSLSIGNRPDFLSSIEEISRKFYIDKEVIKSEMIEFTAKLVQISINWLTI